MQIQEAAASDWFGREIAFESTRVDSAAKNGLWGASMKLLDFARGGAARRMVAMWLFATPGCCCDKGFIFRGDFSLELNRIPFMSSHGPRYCEDPSCGTTCCGESCAASGVAVLDETASAAPVCEGGACRAPLARPVVRAAHHHEPEGDITTGPAYSKFLPVPTRPAFSRGIDHIDSEGGLQEVPTIEDSHAIEEEPVLGQARGQVRPSAYYDEVGETVEVTAEWDAAPATRDLSVPTNPRGEPSWVFASQAMSNQAAAAGGYQPRWSSPGVPCYARPPAGAKVCRCCR